jgi:hypothetical protein
MHIENESVETMTTSDREFEEIVEEYEEEILVQEEVPKPPLTNAATTAPAQSKPWCITLIFNNHCICCAFTLQEFYENHMHIYLPKSLTSAGSSSCYA